MKSPLVRRLGVLTAGAVAAGGLSLVGAGSAQAVQPGADPAPATSAAAWLTSQLKGDLLPFGGDAFTNYGGTIDTALGMKTAGVSVATQSAILRAVTANVVAATSDSDFGFVYAGSTAKVAYYAQQNGLDARTFGGLDLIGQLEPQIIDAGPSAGRLFEDPDPAFDYGNVLSQSFAAAALRVAGSPEAGAAQSFLLAQQCTAGFFTEGFAASDKSAADQTCNGKAASTPSVDATALATLVLLQSPDPAAKGAATRAVAWLKSVQATNGSFNPTGTAAGGNAASSGYAGWALGTSGDAVDAARAAAWIRSQQVVNAGSCTFYAAPDNGAVAQSTTSLTNLAAKPISASGNAVVDEFRVATAQTLAALAWAPGGANAGGTVLSADKYAKAGTATRSVTISGAPGKTVCVTSGAATTKQVLDATGTASVALALPPKKGTATLRTVDAGGEVDTASVTVLSPKKLRLRVADRTVRSGQRLKLQVSGLTSREPVTIKVRGKKVVKRAGFGGRKVLRIKVTGKPGPVKVVVKGQFGTRKGTTTVRVVR